MFTAACPKNERAPTDRQAGRQGGHHKTRKKTFDTCSDVSLQPVYGASQTEGCPKTKSKRGTGDACATRRSCSLWKVCAVNPGNTALGEPRQLMLACTSTRPTFTALEVTKQQVVVEPRQYTSAPRRARESPTNPVPAPSSRTRRPRSHPAGKQRSSCRLHQQVQDNLSAQGCGRLLYPVQFPILKRPAGYALPCRAGDHTEPHRMKMPRLPIYVPRFGRSP